MQIDIQAKGVELTEQLQTLIFQKLGTDINKFLKNFDDDIKKAEVRIEAAQRWGYKVSFSMLLPKKEHIYAEEKNKNLDTAINSLKDVVQKEIRNYKDKLQNY